ncbi:MAG TPA: ester cyclase [Vicinamibacterales bacterium]|nr:ester cyclase [Vicinamibacterales bacterium]
MPSEPSITPAETASSSGIMTREEIVALFDRRQTAWDNLDAEALANDYADDCRIESPAGGTHRGRIAAQKVFEAVFDAFLDQKMRTESLVIDGNLVSQLVSIEGTNMGGFLGLPPSGKPFHLSAVFLYELKDGRIWRERRIYDFTGLLTQIGVLKTKPA